jgi:hypothetical protein
MYDKRRLRAEGETHQSLGILVREINVCCDVAKKGEFSRRRGLRHVVPD